MGHEEAEQNQGDHRQKIGNRQEALANAQDHGGGTAQTVGAQRSEA